MQSGITNINDLPSTNKQQNNINLNVGHQDNNINMQNVPILQNQVIPQQNQVISQQNQVIPQQNQVMQSNEQFQISNNPNNPNNPSNPNNYNEMISQLQQASSKGVTGLPSRDIPMDPAQVINDVHIKPNFIPPPPQVNNTDYIKNYSSENDIINNHNKEISNINTFEFLFNELYIPLLVTGLYFIFQMPFFMKNLLKTFPSLFNKDGNANSYGNLLISLTFGLSFYFLNYIVNYITVNG